MSGTSYENTCPKCGGFMMCYSDWKPYDSGFGECLECGFEYHTAESQLTLDEVNEKRAEMELEPLKEFRKREE